MRKSDFVKGEVAFLALMLGCVLSSGPANAQTTPVKFETFNDFFKKLSQAAPESYLAPTAPTNGVKDPGSFEEMRQHALKMYSGVSVKHSFLLGSDHFDCVPMAQQPSVRLLGLKSIAAAPPFPPAPAGAGASTGPDGLPTIASGPLAPDQTVDAVGNSVQCEDGTIPMRRITLEELSRFETLQQFFQKGPDGAGQLAAPGQPKVANATQQHKYAHSNQSVANIGGSSIVNLWNPNVNTALQEVFSLSQQWYAAYIGSTVQTAEDGWQNYPQKYGTHDSRLFTYWTADGYNKTGCYNLDCAAFVQTNHSWALGQKFPNYSIAGGAQYAVTLEYYLTGGNWWFSVNGTWIGYYPAKLYGTGPMAQAASSIDYGGETVGTTIWPPMGSGAFANTGPRHAAYQSNIFYIKDAKHSYYATLHANQPSTSCFTDITTNNSGVSGANTYFYFGGPGGKTC